MLTFLKLVVLIVIDKELRIYEPGISILTIENTTRLVHEIWEPLLFKVRLYKTTTILPVNSSEAVQHIENSKQRDESTSYFTIAINESLDGIINAFPT